MISYFERRKKLSFRSLSLSLSTFLSPSVLAHCTTLTSTHRPFSTLEKLATAQQYRKHTAEKVAFGFEMDNVKSRAVPSVIYSTPAALVHGPYKGIVLFKALTSILCPWHLLFPDCFPGLSLIMYGTGKQWPSAHHAPDRIGHAACRGSSPSQKNTSFPNYCMLPDEDLEIP